MVDGAFYAQKCCYWVRDQEKIKSNELAVSIVVIDVLGSYDTKFGVIKLERLTSFGSRVVNEVVPFKNKYNIEVSMSIFATQADSMFFAHQMPQPDPGPLSFDKIESIRQLGSVTPEDLLGSKRYDC